MMLQILITVKMSINPKEEYVFLSDCCHSNMIGTFQVWCRSCFKRCEPLKFQKYKKISRGIYRPVNYSIKKKIILETKKIDLETWLRNLSHMNKL